VKNRTRLLVVEDEARVRRGLVMRLALEPDIEVVGEARDGAEAVAQAQALKPDIVVIDLNLPGMDGFQVIRLLSAVLPAGRVLAVSVSDDMTARRAATAAGAEAFVAKQEGPNRLLAAIRELSGRAPRDGTAAE
jgi:DNA-binding NarL/FixJ family response regulator